MSDDTAKTPLDHVHDTVTQLKEMRHYSKNNVELLTAQWLMFDGELKKLGQAGKIEDLMVRQGEFYDALETAIAELEELAAKLTPAVEGAPPQQGETMNDGRAAARLEARRRCIAVNATSPSRATSWWWAPGGVAAMGPFPRPSWGWRRDSPGCRRNARGRIRPGMRTQRVRR